MEIGVLALQGDFREHRRMLQSLGAVVAEVRLPEHLKGLSGLIVPGGESTTIGKLAAEYGVDQAVKERYDSGELAVWGTCAGAIWIAREIEGSAQKRLGLMDICVRRNAFGRQVDSFEEFLDIEDFDTPFHAVFIRAPILEPLGDGVRVLARCEDAPVFVSQDRMWASSFHPELTGDNRLHKRFLKFCKR
ncbi:MAG: pyridoxal 5'-phosphate synthase glutaminase subunit PdxT [Acidobacteriota bacterium]